METISVCPHHGFDTWMLVNHFYGGMSPAMNQLLETMCGGDFLSKHNPCINCQSTVHPEEHCPIAPSVRDLMSEHANVVGQYKPQPNAPYGNTYNSNWKNHPNLSWKPNPLTYVPSGAK